LFIKVYQHEEGTMSRVRLLAVGLLFSSVPSLAQHPEHAAAMAKSGMTAAQKIASAKSAAPTAISAHATIMDFPDKPGGEMKQLSAGTNGWVCYPTTPSSMKGGNDPMCLDKQWQGWAEAWMKKTPPPAVAGHGIAYMLMGDRGASNTDPFATEPKPDNHWVVSPPHIMLLVDDPKMLDTYPDDPKSGGPWVMWKGTPYAHLMVPVSRTLAAK
jgi:hypothetical protein